MAGVGQRSSAGPRLFERVQELQERLDAAPDSPARTLAEELVGALVELYGEGIARLVAGLSDGRGIESVAEDPFVATLLLVHDLHPVALVERVRAALEAVRPYMESHGGNVELLELTAAGVARIRLEGSCSDCSASSVTLELAIKQALDEHAPDLAGLEVSGVEPEATGLAPELAMPQGDPVWVPLPEASELPEGALRAMRVADQGLVVGNVDGTLLAFLDACADCGGPLAAAALSAGALACPGCGRTYFLPRAGRSTDADRLQLTPVPLLREAGGVKVATPPSRVRRTADAVAAGARS